MLQTLLIQDLKHLIKNAADRNRTSTDIQKPHRKGDCAASADSCTRFVQLFCMWSQNRHKLIPFQFFHEYFQIQQCAFSSTLPIHG